MNDKITLNDTELEAVNGGFAIKTFDLKRGDKFQNAEGKLYYVGKDYTNATPETFIFCIRETPGTGEVRRVNATGAVLLNAAYLGVDIAELERLLPIAI